MFVCFSSGCSTLKALSDTRAKERRQFLNPRFGEDIVLHRCTGWAGRDFPWRGLSRNVMRRKPWEMGSSQDARGGGVFCFFFLSFFSCGSPQAENLWVGSHNLRHPESPPSSLVSAELSYKGIISSAQNHLLIHFLPPSALLTPSCASNRFRAGR